MSALHRHQLVRLTEAGWRCALAAAWDADARACLQLWADRDLPLVVTRQAAPVAAPDTPPRPAMVALGLPAPSPWRGRRIALAVEAGHIAGFDEFPTLGDPALAIAASGPDWDVLARALAPSQATARVYGSHGWQALTGLPHAHAGSDIDLWIAVADAAHADAVAAALWDAGDAMAARLDGELTFPDGRAVAWREWRAWRAGLTRAILCRTLTDAALVHHPFTERIGRTERVPC